MMAVLLRIGGILMIFLGVGNIIGASWSVTANALTVHGLVCNGAVFVLPGMGLLGIADAVGKKRQKTV